MASKYTKGGLTSLIIREMQIKAIMRYHLLSVRMAIIKMHTNNKCRRRYEEKGTRLHCWWEIGTTTVENNMKVSQKIKKRTTI